MHLPDDVALTTSKHHGKQLRILYKLWGAWLEAIGEDQDALYGAMLDAVDCFQSSTFDALHGYYRSALSNLRAALDVVAIGTVGNLAPADPVYTRWKANNARLVFPRAKLRHLTNEPVSSLLFKQDGWTTSMTNCPPIAIRDRMLATARCGKVMARYIRRLRFEKFSDHKLRPMPQAVTWSRSADRILYFPTKRR